jgi:hypothetical protein
MLLLLSVGLAADFASSALLPDFVNITILAPAGTTNHSDPRLFCPPTKSIDVALFFFENYLAQDLPDFVPVACWASTSGRYVYGNCSVPKGYALAIVPMHAELMPDSFDAIGGAAPSEAGPPNAGRSRWEGFLAFIGWMLNTTLGTHTYLQELEARKRSNRHPRAKTNSSK